jgi:hypothetical protein
VRWSTKVTPDTSIGVFHDRETRVYEKRGCTYTLPTHLHPPHINQTANVYKKKENWTTRDVREAEGRKGVRTPFRCTPLEINKMMRCRGCGWSLDPVITWEGRDVHLGCEGRVVRSVDRPEPSIPPGAAKCQLCKWPVWRGIVHPCCEFWRAEIEAGHACPACAASRASVRGWMTR